MESEARYAWVGGTLILLFLALAAGIYWLSGAGDHPSAKRYTVYFRKQSLEGLQIGGEVRMRGIKVGRVTDYTILPDTARGVRVLLEVDARTPVLDGVQAEVNRKLVTGIAGVDLVNTTIGGAPLTRRFAGEPYPVIAEGVPEVTRMTGELIDLGSLGGVTLEKINLLLSQGNQRAFRDALENTRDLTGRLGQVAPVLRETLEQSRRTAESLARAGVAAESTLNTAARDLDSLTAQSRDTLSEARTVLELGRKEVGALSMSLRLSADLAGQDVQATAKVLRDSGSAMQQTAHALTLPEALLFGAPRDDLGPGENAR